MNNFKKYISIVVVLGIIFTMFAGCQKEANSSTSQENVEINEIFKSVEPLENEMSIKVGTVSTSTYGFTTFLIEELGGFEASNLNIDQIVFGSGPVVVEAMSAGECDVATYGVTGALAGTIGQGFVTIGASSTDYKANRIYAQNDSHIVESGAQNPDYPNLLGTAEDWKGQEIYIPLGTNLHYTLVKGLEILGVSSEDVELTHMDVPNVNTAIRAGKAELGGVWANYIIGDLNDVATSVMDSRELDIKMVSSIQTTQEALANKERALAIEKWLELYFIVKDWIYDSDENMTKAVELFVQWNEENGVSSTEEEIVGLLQLNNVLGLEENLEIMTTVSDKGYENQFVEYFVEPLKFFVELGNYTQADLEKFSKPEYMDFSLVENIAAAKASNN